MFANLSDSLSKIFDKLTRKGFLSEEDCDLALREVRIALLEADVSLPIVKNFIIKVKEEIVGKEIIKTVSPGQMVIKLVQDQLIKILGSQLSEINLKTSPPAIIMVVGLQGSGKTTSCAKIGLRLKQKHNKKVLLASLDVARPGAQEQLEVLAKTAQICSLEINDDKNPIEITKRALQKAKLGGYDVLILDTAGRLHIDESLMSELKEIEQISKPIETLLVADSMTGQDAVNIAKNFNEKIALTGIVLTRIDGDARGGAALSIRETTGCPIKYLGVGEKISELEEFYPERIASRILDMGDIVSFVEKAAQNIDLQEAEKIAKKMQKGDFDMNDMLEQIKTIRKMGGIGGLMGMLPGVKKLTSQLADANIDEKIIAKQEAIIFSMNKKERRDPRILNASRKIRIAKGSGSKVQDVNKLIKQYQNMKTVMKRIGKIGKTSFLRSGIGKIFG